MKELYKIHAEVCKVFSNPTRLEILNLLRDKEMSVTELIGKTKLSQANISQHLGIMKNKGIVTIKSIERYIPKGMALPMVDPVRGLNPASRG